MKVAVILAAGRGSRYNQIGFDKPKGFIKVNNQTIIERSINILLDNGYFCLWSFTLSKLLTQNG